MPEYVTFIGPRRSQASILDRGRSYRNADVPAGE